MRWWILVALVAGCAGENSEKKPATVPGDSQSAAVETGSVTAEQNDAIEALFRRKAQQLQSCWQDEYERNHNRALQGDLTVGLTVTRSGKPTGVRILKSTLGNAEVEDCVAKSVAAWGFPEVTVDCPYTRTVHLGAQF